MNKIIDFDVAQQHSSTLKCLDLRCNNMHNFIVIEEKHPGTVITK